jgi:hypothetical protein
MTLSVLLRQLPRPRTAGERVGVRGRRPASDIPLTLTLHGARLAARPSFGPPEGREGMERA